MTTDKSGFVKWREQKGLVEKAKAIEIRTTNKGRRTYDEEAIDLALAWIDGTVKTSQVARALELKGNSVDHFLAYALREAFRGDRLRITGIRGIAP